MAPKCSNSEWLTFIGAHSANLGAPERIDLRQPTCPRYPRTTHACLGAYVAADVAAALAERDVSATGNAALPRPGGAARLRKRRWDKCAQTRLTVGCGLVSGGRAVDCWASSLTCKIIASTLPGAVPRKDRAALAASQCWARFIGCLDGSVAMPNQLRGDLRDLLIG